jgi:hypothetical protein
VAVLALPPASVGDLYLYRGDEVTQSRPVMTGDVFADVEIPGVEDGPGLALVLAHPCSMRKGAHVRDRIMVCRVTDGSPIRPDQWASGHFGVMPLPDLVGDGRFGHRAVFELAGRVSTSRLDISQRLACLEETGIALLLQRVAFNYTRATIEIDVLHSSVAHLLAEAELLEAWVDAVANSTGGAPSGELIRAAEIEFDALMRETDPVSGLTNRDKLIDGAARASIRRLVGRRLPR